MSDWQTNSSEVVYETPWFKMHRDEVLNHKGKPLTMSYLEVKKDTAAIIATDAEGRILLQRNYRYNINQTVWEVPAGFAESGEDLLEAAKRELMEETGLASNNWGNLGTFYIAPGVAKIKQTYFLAQNTHKAPGERDEDEQITAQRFFTLDEIETMLNNNEINSYMAPIGIYLAKIQMERKEQ